MDNYIEKSKGQNEEVRNGIELFVTGKKTFEELSKEKDKYFDDAIQKNKPPKIWKQSVKSLGSSALATMGNVALETIGGYAVGLGFQVIGSLLDYIVNYNDRIIATGKEAGESIVQQTQSYVQQKDQLEELSAQYGVLSKGVKIVGNTVSNVSLTDTEFQEFLDTNNQIASLAPTLVSGWDEQGNAILNAGTNAQSLNEQIQEYNTLQRDLAHYNIKNKIDSQLKGMKAESQLSQSEMAGLRGQADQAQARYDSLSKLYDQISSKETAMLTVDADTETELHKRFSEMGIFFDRWANDDGTVTITLDTSQFDTSQVKEVKTLVDDLRADAELDKKQAEKEIANVKMLDEQAWRDILPSMQYLVSTTSMFDSWEDKELAGQFQGKLNSMVAALNMSDINAAMTETGRDLYDLTIKDIIGPIASATDEQKDVLEELFSFEPKEGETVSQIAKRRDTLLEAVANIRPDDFWTKSSLAKSLGYAYTGSEGETVWNTKSKLDDIQQAMANAGASKQDQKAVRDFLNNEIPNEDFEIAYSIIGSDDESALKNLANFKIAFEEAKALTEKEAIDNDLSLESMTDRVATTQALLSTITTAISESNSAVGLSEDTINTLASSFTELEDIDTSALFDYETGVKLNQEALREFGAAQEAIVKNKFAESINEQAKEVRDLSKQLNEAKDETSKNEIQDQLDLAKETLDSLRMQQAIYEGIISDRNKWFAGTTEADQNYDTAVSKIASLKKLRKDEQGLEWIGSNEFRSGLDYFWTGSADTLSPEEVAKTYDTLMPLVEDWYQVNQDGTANNRASIEAFIADSTRLSGILGSSISSIDAIGTENAKAILNAEEYAQAWGVSREVLEDVAGVLEKLGYEVDIVDTASTAYGTGTFESPRKRDFIDESQRQDYDSAMGKFKDAYSDQNSDVQELTGSLKDYTEEQLKAINLNDGMYTTGFEAAEKSLDGLISGLGLSSEEAGQLINVLSDMGFLKVEPQVESANLEQAQLQGEELLTTLQKTGELKTNIDFSADITGLDNTELSNQINELTSEKASLEAELKVNPDDSGVQSALNALNSEIESREFQIKINTAISEGNTVDELLDMDYGEFNKTLELGVDVDTEEGKAKIDALKSSLEQAREDTSVKVTVELDESQFNSLLTGITGKVPVTAEVTNKDELSNLPDAHQNVNQTASPDSSITGPHPAQQEVIQSASPDSSLADPPPVTQVVNRVSGEEPGEVSDASGSVIFDIGQSPTEVPPAWGIANFRRGIYPTSVPPITGYVHYKIGSVERPSGLGGKATGTMLSPARALGTAYANGKVSLDEDEEAIVNEVGQESIVRDGRWLLIPGGVHKENLKKGDIIFSASQTEDLRKRGRAIGHGKAYAEGTASKLKPLSNAYADGTDDSITKVSDGLQKILDHFSNFFDFSERSINRIIRSIDEFQTVIDAAVTMAGQNKHIDMMIESIQELRKTYHDSILQYEATARDVANRVGLSDELMKKVQNGTIKVEELSADDKAKVEAYAEWYDKANDLRKEMYQLKADEKDALYSKLEVITEHYDALVSKYEARGDKYGAKISWMDAVGKTRAYVDPANRGKDTPYIDTLQKQRETLGAREKLIQREIDKYNAQIKEIQKSDSFNKADPDYQEALAKKAELEGALYENKEAYHELTQAIREARYSALEVAIDGLKRVADRMNAVMEYFEEVGTGITEHKYNNQISNNNKQIIALNNLINEKRKELVTYEYNSEEYQRVRQEIADLNNEIVELGTNNERIKKQIRELRWEKFYEHSTALENMASDIQHVQNLLNEDNFLNADATWTEDALGNMFAISKGIEIEQKKIAEYKAALNKLEEELANGNITQKQYNEESAEFIKIIQDSAVAIEDYKDQYLDMYIEKVKLENELLQDNISLRKEALDKIEDYYDYDRNLRKQTRDVDNLKAQIAALDGVNLPYLY